MRVSLESTSTLGRRMTVGIPAEKIDAAVDTKLQEARRTLRLDGFRPGKVPFTVVRQRFGASVRNEVLGELMRDSFVEAVQTESVAPASMPTFQTTRNAPGEEVEYVATFEVYPQVELQAFSAVNVEEPHAEVTDEDVEQIIENLRKQHGTWQKVDRAAAMGDRVNIDYAGEKDGEAFDGGSAKGQSLVLGSGRMIPGFEDGIVGMKPGEEKDLSVTFPEDYSAEDLKGQAVVFKITVNSVEEQSVPDLDEAFVERFDITEGGVDAFRAEVRKNMERELAVALRARVRGQVMDGLVDAHEFDVPAALISDEVGRMRQRMMQQFGSDTRLDPAMLPDDIFQEQASRSVRLGLVVGAIIEKHELKPDADKVRARVDELASQYEDQEAVVNHIYANAQQLQQVEASVLEEQVVELVLDTATRSEVNMTYEEAVRAAQNQQ